MKTNHTIRVLLITLLILASCVMTFAQPPMPKKAKNQPLQPLTQAEMDGLFRMRLEEKFARDLCEELRRSSNMPLFNGLRNVSVQRIKQIDKQLEKYRSFEPITEDRPGKFTDKDQYKRYRKCLQLGKLSKLNALREIAGVKELQILDYGNLIAVSEKPELTKLLTVYLTQSQAQLRRVYNRIGKQGASYTPQFMERDTFFEMMQ